MTFLFDKEGLELIEACAYARILHAGNGGIVRKLQASLARVCCAYAQRRGGMEYERLLDRMSDEILKEVERIKGNGG